LYRVRTVSLLSKTRRILDVSEIEGFRPRFGEALA
jgi:hypothetical protein